MKIALAQINPIVGDIAGNTEMICRLIQQAKDQKAELAIFPELAISGYPPKDLLLKPAIIDRCVQAVNRVASLCTDIAAIVGYPCPTGQSKGRPLYNAAALCWDGVVKQRYFKSLLPSYDVFDETRYFEPGPEAPVMQFGDVKLGITICEDLWNDQQLIERHLYHADPLKHLITGDARMLVNCSASPFTTNKHPHRVKLLAAAAQRTGLPVVYCNQVGGNDELVFDGNSCVLDASGEVIAHARDFQTDLMIVDVPLGEQPITSRERHHQPSEGIESVFAALTLGLQDYCHKCGFDSVVLGLSGGIDSAVTAALAVAALGPKQVYGVAMPSRYSSEGSVTDAAELAKRLDIRFDVIPIQQAHEAIDQMMAAVFAGQSPDSTEENIQARIRGVILMALSNKFGSLLITTGNKSELAVGYCTLYGDMAGGLAVLSDVPKTMVFQLADWINESPDSPLRQQFGQAVIPPSTITKPPSAELRPDQTDQDTLPPYAVLDQIIERYVELEQSTQQIIDQLKDKPPGTSAETIRQVIRMIDRNEHKRRQAAPGLKVTGRAFGFGRRMPMAQRWKD